MHEDCLIHYERHDDLVRCKLQSVTNHELMDVITGLWARLGSAERAETVRMLVHYDRLLNFPAKYPDRYLPAIAKAIYEGPAAKEAIDLLTDDRS